MKDNKLLLGAHTSIAGGLQNAIERGDSIGCTAIQIFTKSNRQWLAKPLNEDDIKNFIDAYKKSPIQSVVTHAAYLINLGAANKEINKKSVDSLKEELDRCEKLQIPYLILHPGASSELSEQDCIDLIASNLNAVFSANPKGQASILLENTAGQGSAVGYKFEHLAQIYEKSKFKNRLGVCFDTCHAFAAGYDFVTEKKYKELWKEFDDILGMDLLKAIHLNDSKKEIGSKVDRHEFLGKGKIGIEAFRLLINDEKLITVPKILETPVEGGIEDYIPDLKFLISLLSKENKYWVKDTPLERYL